MTGAPRRAFEAEMTVKYCGGNPLLAETICGWGRHTVAVGLAERRTGLRCLGAQSAFSGRKRWEERYPEAAEALHQLAETHAQQDPTFRTTLASTRLTAHAALDALRAQGDGEEPWPSPSTEGSGAPASGLSAAQSGQSQTAKKDCRDRHHFYPYGKKDQAATASPHVKRWRIDCQATVVLGDVSRGGLTRGAYRACDHDRGVHEQYIPCGIVDDDSAQLRITCGRAATTSDCIVDALAAWWAGLDEAEPEAMTRLQITRDHGPESRGMRTQFLHRMVQFADAIGKPIHLLYSPPSHSKDHPIERC